MPRRPKDSGQKPKTDTQLIREAAAELTQDEEAYAKRRERDDRKRGRIRWWQVIDRRILYVLGAILVVLVGDGIRRENREFCARLISHSGQVAIADAKGGSVTPKEDLRLQPGAVVTTGPDAKATLELEDGSRIVVKGDSEVAVRGLDYNRGAQYRDHAFAVRRGHLLGSVGERFGADSELTVTTPGAVAAVRGTTFLVSYDAQQKNSYAACKQGAMSVTGNGVQWQPVASGQLRAVDARGAVYGGQELPAPVAQEFLAEGELNLPPSKDPFLRRIEGGLNRALDPVLSVLGIGRSSWGVLAGNRARMEAARLAARDIFTLLEGMTELPERVDLTTLDGLGLVPTRRDQMLQQLAGNRLEGYLSNGRDYVLLLRGKDRDRTRYLVTRKGVQNVQGNPAAVEAAIQALGGPATGGP